MGIWDEPVGRTVGRRVSAETSIEDAAVLLETLARLARFGVCRRGVWRFKTFEEADEWALTQMGRHPAFRS